MNKHRAIAFSKLCMCCETKQFLAYANYDVRKIADLRIFGIDRGETEQLLAASQTTAISRPYTAIGLMMQVC